MGVLLLQGGGGEMRWMFEVGLPQSRGWTKVVGERWALVERRGNS